MTDPLKPTVLPSDAATTPSEPTVKDAATVLGRALGRAAASAAKGTRETIRKNPTADRVYRAGVGVVGGGVTAIGVALIPLPGPGALVALGGLGILSTEFEGAKKARTAATKAVRKGAQVAADAVRRRTPSSRD